MSRSTQNFGSEELGTFESLKTTKHKPWESRSH